MFYYTLATLFAQLAITLRLVTASGSLTPGTYYLLCTQGVRRDGEEPQDRLLSMFYQFRTGYFRDSWFDPFRVASRYDLFPFPLNQTSKANPNFKSDGIPRPSLR